jgi:hypothetical protein
MTTTETHLRAAMTDVTDDLVPPANLARQAIRGARRAHHARIAGVISTAAAGVMVTGGTGWAVLADRHGPTAPRVSSPELTSVAYLTGRIDTRLAAQNGVLHWWATNAEGHVLGGGERWNDLVTGASRIDETIHGRRFSLAAYTRDGVSYTTAVDYSRHRYYQESKPVKDGVLTVVAPIAAISPQELRAALDHPGTWAYAGRERIDGHEAVRLRRVDPASPRQELWADATTFDVLRVQEFDAKGRIGWTEHFEWLPRTPEALASATLTPPAGFTRVANPDAACLASPQAQKLSCTMTWYE